MAAPNIVNVTSIFGKTDGVQLDTTTTTDIITCGADQLYKVNSIIAANIDGSSASTVTVYFYDHSRSHRTALADSVTVPAKSTLVILGKDSPIYLEESDQIEAGAGDTNDIHLTISYEILNDA
tara:strand:- start:6562 stop:6930 length:369 start_codon:yes stop_codon:yes gene_type:complete